MCVNDYDSLYFSNIYFSCSCNDNKKHVVKFFTRSRNIKMNLTIKYKIIKIINKIKVDKTVKMNSRTMSGIVSNKLCVWFKVSPPHPRTAGSPRCTDTNTNTQ